MGTSTDKLKSNFRYLNVITESVIKEEKEYGVAI